MTSQEKALLVLKTSDLTYNTSNSIGTANATGTKCTWNNINLRVLLGNLYDTYDRFNLTLNTFTTGPLNGVIPDADTGTYITLSGLPIVNNTYAVRTNSISNEAFIGSVSWKPQSTISTSLPFLGSIAATTLNVIQNNNGSYISFVGTTGGVSSLQLTITTAVSIPIGSYLTGNGIVGNVTLVARISPTVYMLSSAQTIANNTPITALFPILPNNIRLSVGSEITGNGVTAGTVITAQTGTYEYTVNNNQNIAMSPMMASVSTTTTYCTDVKYYQNSRITFTKNQDICNLTLTIKRTSNDALPTSTLPNMIFVFDIEGIDEYKVKDVTQTRLLK